MQDDKICSQDSIYLEKNTTDTSTGNDENDNSVRRATRANTGTGVKQILTDTKANEYHTYNHSLLIKKKWLQRIKKSVILAMLKQNVSNREYLMNTKVLHVVFSQQMSAKKGIRYDRCVIEAIMKEFTQFDQGTVPEELLVEPVNANSFSREMKRQALEAVKLITEKGEEQ